MQNELAGSNSTFQCRLFNRVCHRRMCTRLGMGFKRMTACENCFFGGKTVGYKGDIKSSFVVVGESPGIMEIIDGKPFVGPSGKLLDSVLAPYMHLFDTPPLITNAFGCMPRQKDPNKVSQATARCNNRLLAELKAHPRKLILALGNAALWATTGNHGYKITQVRGKVFSSELAEAGIVAAVHPAFLLRGGGNMQQFNRDIHHAMELYAKSIGKEKALSDTISSSRGMQISGSFKPGKYTVVKTKKERDKIISDLQDGKFKYAAADTETEGFNPRRTHLDKIEFTGEGILCLGVCYEPDHSWVIPYEFMEPELFENDVKWCWHNGKFDIGWLREYGFPRARVDDDTMLLSYLLNERGGIHDLEQVGSDWLQAPNYKGMLDKYLPSKRHSYAHIPREVLYKYQAIDTNLTFALRNVLRDKVMADKKLAQVYERIMVPASEFLHRVEVYGFKTDLNKVAENEIRLQGEADKYEAAFCKEAKKHGYEGINLRSPQQVGDLLYGTLKLAPTGTSTDYDHLEKLREKHPEEPIIKYLMDYRGVHKQLSTFVIPIRDKTDPTDGRIHTSFKLHGTTTGRLSSNKPNLQNIDRDKRVRSQFVAPKGRAILDIDLSQAELRMLACLSGDPTFCEIFRSGISPHDVTSMKLYGAVDKEKKIVAKCINFGIVYGITASGIVSKLEVEPGITQVPTRKEAQSWIDVWAESYPLAWEYIERCRAAPIRGQTLVSFTGRKRRFSIVSRESLHHLQNEAANFPHQSGAHDITLLAGIRVQDEFAKKYDAHFVNEVHDALLSELPDDMATIVRAARLLCSTMEEVPREWGLTEVPFLAEATIGPAWEDGVKFNPFDEKFTDLNPWKGVSYVQLLSAKAA